MKNQFKKLLAILLLFTFLFSLSACGDSKTENKEQPGTSTNEEISNEDITNDSLAPLLYKVSDSKGSVCWILGSIHLGEENFYPLPEYITTAFEQADALAVECDIVSFENDLSAQMNMLQIFQYSNGAKISDYLSEELYEEAKKILEENQSYASYLDYYYPVMWMQLIDNFLYEKFDFDFELGIDRHMMGLATEANKEILEIESVAFQYEMLANFSHELQALLLESSIASYVSPNESETAMNDLMQLWKSGDEKAFAEYLETEDADVTDEEQQFYEEYHMAMYTNRNIAMANFVEESLKTGSKNFVCVGAAHVIGEGGMVDLLRDKGYTVEIVK